MEWIKSKISDHPKAVVFGVFGISLASFFLYRHLFKRQSEIAKYWIQLGNDIEKKLKNNTKIQFMPTNEEVYIDNQFSNTFSKEGFPFTLKWLKSLKNKPILKTQDFDKKLDKNDDPFAPPLDEDLVVRHDLTKKHALMLNKYPVTNHHVLIITKEFEHQSTALSKEDIEACLIVMKSVKSGFIFYNCGKNSGASQPHKHMQCFPESNFATKGRLPVSIAIERYKTGLDLSKPFKLPEFDFVHSIRFFKEDINDLIENDKLKEATNLVFECYNNVYKDLKLSEDVSYNTLITQSYILIVVREKESFGEISLNTLAFAGSLFNTNPDKLDYMKQVGPLNMLKDVAAKL